MNSHRWHPSPPPSPSQPAPWYSQIINGLQLYSEITTWLIAPLHKVDSNPNFTWVFCRARASTATRLSSLQALGWNTLPAKHHTILLSLLLWLTTYRTWNSWSEDWRHPVHNSFRDFLGVFFEYYLLYLSLNITISSTSRFVLPPSCTSTPPAPCFFTSTPLQPQ